MRGGRLTQAAFLVLATFSLATLPAGPVRAQVPANDACEDAIALVLGLPVVGTTEGASFDPDAAARGACAGAGPAVTAAGVWYSVIGTNRLITATTCPDSGRASAAYDTQISIYCAGCDGLACIGGSDDDCPSLPAASEVQWCSAEGVEYLVFVHGAGDEVGDFELLVSQDVLFCRGDSACQAPPPPCEDSEASLIEDDPGCGGVFAPGAPEDLVNGGCGAGMPAFTRVEPGDTICGSTGSDGARRDEDWYELVLSSNARVSACVGSLEAELELSLAATGGSGSCGDAGDFDPVLVVPAGGEDCLVVDLGPGTWWLRVVPTAGTFVPCPTEYTGRVDALPLGELGACCEVLSGSCFESFELDCGDTFLGSGSDCAACDPEPCLFRAVAAERDSALPLLSPRAGNGIAFAPPFDGPHACPFASGDADPSPAAGAIIFYQVDQPGLESLRVELDADGESLRIRY